MVALMLSAWSTTSLAWDGVKTGKISAIEVANAQNYAFRVWLDGSSMCGTSHGWGYVNKDFDNYEAMVSTLTSVYLAGKSVTLFTTKTGEFCQIGYVIVR
jgi:hypothetical protein